MVSTTYSQPWSKSIEQRIPEMNSSYIWTVCLSEKCGILFLPHCAQGKDRCCRLLLLCSPTAKRSVGILTVRSQRHHAYNSISRSLFKMLSRCTGSHAGTLQGSVKVVLFTVSYSGIFLQYLILKLRFATDTYERKNIVSIDGPQCI